jgi:hypothetical protein
VNKGVAGVAVALAAAGAVLVYFGIRDVEPVGGLRELAKGKLPQGRANTPLKFAGVSIGNILSDFAGAITTGGGYKLGNVKSWVAKAANYIGPKFGIKTIYGWAPGLYDHPKGLALDFMITGLPNGRATGDALAAFVQANAKTLNVTYVIWYRRIWSVARAGEGWRPYVGDSDHTDHVHVSFEAAVQGSGPQYA